MPTAQLAELPRPSARAQPTSAPEYDLSQETVSIAEAAGLLQVSEEHLLELIKLDRLPAAVGGPTLRVKLPDLLVYRRARDARLQAHKRSPMAKLRRKLKAAGVY